MKGLTAHQIEALDRYERLREEHPELFAVRERRPIITDRAELEEFASSKGAVLGVAAETPFFLFVCDLVEDARRLPFVYSRLIHMGQLKGGVNVAVLATIANPALGELGSIVLIEQERHATGEMETAIPRGFAEPGQDGITAAKRELREESGYIGEEVEFLGESVIDSGSGNARVSFYWIRVTARSESAPEAGEAIRSVRLMSPHELQESIRTSSKADSFTLQALYLAGLRGK
jgi:ADP-ribose pyrophosphatase